MLSLQRFLSKGDRFFDLLEANAEDAKQSVQGLMELIAAPENERSLERLIHSRRQDKRITEQITALLCSTFITPLEREDIEALSSALSRIPKVIKKFAERFLLAHCPLDAELFSQQARLLDRSTETLAEMVRELRHGVHIDKIQGLNGRLHEYEGEADLLILELLRDLYSGRYQALEVIVLRDLFELLEKVIDRCRDAGNVIFQIALKNS
jgi:uncharacterized protein